MKNLTWQNPEQLFVAQELINKVKSKCCGIKVHIKWKAKNILFIMHMPPPVHGAAMVGQYIHDSKLINDKFDSHYINLTTAKNLQDIGKVGIRKLVDFIMLLRRIRKSLKEIRPDLVYVTPNACGGAF